MTTKPKHTPRPLYVSPMPGGNIEIVDNNGAVLATVYGDDDDPQCWPVTANATLFAAAPELLVLLTEAVERYESGDPHTGSWWLEAKDAIAKATGRDNHE